VQRETKLEKRNYNNNNNYHNNNKNNYHNNNNRNRYVKKEKDAEKVSNAKKCPHCGCDMREKGASDCMGGISFKCKNKKCGRRVWVHKKLTRIPEPLIVRSRFWKN
jgi:hypothetical protein